MTSSPSEIYRVEHEGDHFFDAEIPADFFEKIRRGDVNRDIYHPFSHRQEWTQAIQNEYAATIIGKADEVKDGPVPQLSFSEYRRFAIDGDRAGYQAPYFKRRENMGYLALALCLTGDKEKYMPRLLDYCVAIMEETTWCIPAHSHWKIHMLMDRQPTDLFCSETGAAMAILCHILGAELDKEIEHLSEKLSRQILNRTIYNVFYHPESCEMHGWYNTSNPVNWTPWCSYNNLIVAILLEKDNERLAAFIREFLRINANFAFLYNDDGYCDEGPSYYSKAGLMLFNVIHLMHKLLPGSMDRLLAMPRIRAIFEFIAKLRIGNNHQVSFGDALPFFSPALQDVLPCAALIHSDALTEVGTGGKASLGHCGDHLNTGYKLLFKQPHSSLPHTSPEPFSYFKDRLAIIRSDGFSVALKAGTNGEGHNHNDLGHVTIYYQGEPIIVDPSYGIYSRINFSNQRYTLWYTRGSGHNAPVFGQTEQLAGKIYTSYFERADKGNLTLNLSQAYPQDAGIEAFTRRLDFQEDKVVLEDDFRLVRPQQATIHFLTPQKVEILSANTLAISNVIVTLSGIELAETRQMPPMKGGWNCALTLLNLQTSENHYRITFSGR